MIDSQNISEIFEKYGLSKERQDHSLGVADFAQKLAEVNNVDPDKAWLAGAVHDLAREWSPDELTKRATSSTLGINSEEERFPYLLHGKVSADIANKELGINDENILLAIRTHTSGCANMEPLQAIIYASDFLESTKTDPNLAGIYKIALENLNRAINLINLDSEQYLKAAGRELTADFKANLDFYSKFI